MLFGVEISSEFKSVETLKDSSASNTIIEKNPLVRVVGRVEKNKIISCEDEICTTYIRQNYPKPEYDKAYERLNRPIIVKEFARTIVICEGNNN